MKVVVIGAGVVGATTALALAERGVEVTLIDRHPEPAAETSHANGGGITPGHAEPWNSPGILGRLLKGSNDRAPYRIHAHALPGLIAWGASFLWQSKASRYFQNARANTRLAVYSGLCLKRLRERHELSYHQYIDGSLELYFDRAELDHALGVRRGIGDPGVDLREITPAEVAAMEPALAPVAHRMVGALFLPLHESGDACEFAAEMARCAQQLGATLRLGESVQAIVRREGRVVGVRLDSGLLEANAVVLAAGVSSRALARPLRLKLPIQPVKGYSATLVLDRPELAPTIPLLDLEHRIVTARYGERLRIAGLADFEGYDRNIRPGRVQMLLDAAAALLPRLAEEILSGKARTWCGLRPMTPKGPPLLGPTRIPGLYLNTGHGSMGWTQAVGSAEILADIITGREAAIDLSGLCFE